ncbi:sugar O-acetyltransferase [Weissella coleopterorum]|uniref:Sugar O-acetyltransferase n=1 Tax=Weissella coleopterorum TaxID=2714949 RepID=A0A6G8B1B9_9LACO|nr:sugar O-acetyltransferase [Weissella coleopterorum]QIL51131.1 sugar O-acetyltransferase [Weissella coleopterorum]
MNKHMQDPDVKKLMQKDVFKKVDDGDWYQYGHEPQLQAIVKKSAQQIQKINQIAIEDDRKATDQLRQFLPHLAADVDIYFPINSIEYPEKLSVGSRTFINANLQILSAGQVTIGQDCFIGPNCQLYTPNHHPSNPKLRRAGWQYDLPIKIGDDCWFGGSVIVLPGVTIGDNVVIGAGSVVTKDIPSHTMAAGNPARVIKQMPKIQE